MLKQIIKLLFVALLVSPNVLLAADYNTYCESCYSDPYACKTGTTDSSLSQCTSNRYYCFESDQYWKSSYPTPDFPGCKENDPDLFCSSLDYNCGCSSPWQLKNNCKTACFGYCIQKDSDGYNTAVQANRYLDAGLGDIYIGLTPSSCETDRFNAFCNPDKRYYAPNGKDSVYCKPEIQDGEARDCELPIHDCQGCEYCNTDASEYVSFREGYQQAKFYEFKYNGSEYVCEPTGDATGNWRCAPGYYKSAYVKDAEPTTEPNIVCTKCPAGTYMDKAGIAESCTPCSDGSSTWEYKDGKISHTDGNIASSSCKLCPKGYFQKDFVSSRRCQQCNGSGEYQDAEGQTSCKECPEPFTTNNKVLNTSKTQCFIDPTNVTIKDKLNEEGITLSEEVGDDYLFWAGGGTQ